MSSSLQPSIDGGKAGSFELDCFDPSLAEFETAVVPIDSVIDLLSSTHAPDKISEYREAMDNGAKFPPLSVVSIAARYFLADGHKRLSACKRRGMTHVTIEFWPIKRIVADLSRQTARSARRFAALIAGTSGDPGARKRWRRFYWDTVLHWKRFFVTLPSLVKGRDRDESQTSAPVFMRLVRECLRFRGHLILIVIALGALGGAQLYLTWIAKLWTDGPLKTGDHAAMSHLVRQASFAAIVLVGALFSSRYVLQSLDQHLVQELRDRAQKRLLEVELASVRRFQIGELMSRMFNDALSMSQFVREILRRWIGESVVLVGALAMLFRLDWQLAIMMAVAGPIVGGVLSYFGGYIRRRSAAAQREIGELSATFTEQLAGLSTIKGFQTETAERQRFVEKDTSYRRHVMRSQLWLAAMTTGVWAITAAALLIAAWYGTSKIASGRSTPGALLAFCLYAVQTVEPLRRLSEVHGLLQRALASAVRVFEVIDISAPETEGAHVLPQPVRGDLEFREACFSYVADRPILRDFELTVHARETIAIVAASGGGKSTLASLLARFADLAGGRILLDGIDLRSLRLSQLRRAICVIEQKPFIFSGSLLENIRYGSPGASLESVRTAVSLASLEQFVATLPAGLNTYLTESGRNLSGGQQQRIALARAIVRDPAVLVLDEATSAIDSETENAIFSRMKPWLARRTVLLMTHRLATVIRFPRVVVVEDGRVVGDGPAAQLLEGCPAFARLFSEQVAPLENPAKTTLIA